MHAICEQVSSILYLQIPKQKSFKNQKISHKFSINSLGSNS